MTKRYKLIILISLYVFGFLFLSAIMYPALYLLLPDLKITFKQYAFISGMFTIVGHSLLPIVQLAMALSFKQEKYNERYTLE